jgi:hypothetical protein
MFTVGTKVKVLGSSVRHSIGPCNNSTGYVSKIDQIFLPNFGFIQEFTIFFDAFGQKAAGSRCERKRVLNIVPFEIPPANYVKAIQGKGFNTINDLIVKVTGRESLLAIPKVALVPAKLVNLHEAPVLEQLCWMKSILYTAENKYFIVDWLSKKKDPKINNIGTGLINDFNEFMQLPREVQITTLTKKFKQLLRVYRIIVAITEVSNPEYMQEINNHYEQIFYKLTRGKRVLSSLNDVMAYKRLLLQFCFIPHVYASVKSMTSSNMVVGGYSTAKSIKEVDQWKEDLTKLNC